MYMCMYIYIYIYMCICAPPGVGTHARICPSAHLWALLKESLQHNTNNTNNYVYNL